MITLIKLSIEQLKSFNVKTVFAVIGENDSIIFDKIKMNEVVKAELENNRAYYKRNKDEI